MSHISLYPEDFPEQFKALEVEVINLFQQQYWGTLNNVVICRDREGNITACFGDNDWKLHPISRKKSKNHFDFTFLDDTPELQVELKLLAYGWLFNKNTRKSKSPTFSTLETQFSAIKGAYKYLKLLDEPSLSELSNKKKWADFEETLIEKDLTQGSLHRMFVGINHAISLEPWLKYSFGFETKIASINLAKSLSKKTKQQTLVIPERLSNSIFGKAIELIKGALPNKMKIVQVENELQENYLEGKRILDSKIRRSSRFSCTDIDGNIIDSRKYRTAIGDWVPRETRDIIKPLTDVINGVTLNNGDEFRRYLGQLITACYIACGGFSGMRESELNELTPKSYYKDTFGGRDYHMLQSRTFKLGEKRETWVTAPIVKQAINLAEALTRSWREQIKQADNTFNNTLWCNQGYRSKLPIIIGNWNERLQRFCKQFNFMIIEDDYQECVESNPRSLDKVKEKVIVGDPWHLTTHQFRRSLAFYCIKHRLGTVVALKQQFKHLYLSMTKWYTNGGQLASMRSLKLDTEVQKALDEINVESTTSKIFKQWHSDQPLSGKHGKTIVKMRNDIPHIYSCWDTIYQAVKRRTLTLHGTAHSYCKNGYKCNMDGVVMPQFCVNCESESSIIDEEQAQWWQKKHRSLVAYMELDEEISISERSHYITQVRAAENVMKDFDMEFTPFEAELKVTEL
ncbi:hypothetical protein [Shewanella surugensis]|uniref:Integrase n=1 Tax=Shewanella surugensis TaxID=212020 RepID=A0ABT0LK03_9GAMM|nr:hypothetical protein [Shewanella surugensis]MCL1127617.1 hypothetical protein [Shewanella surugensis]